MVDPGRAIHARITEVSRIDPVARWGAFTGRTVSSRSCSTERFTAFAQKRKPNFV